MPKARTRGPVTVECITSPGNKISIAFHTGIGFAVAAGGGFVDGVSIHEDYDGPGLDRVVFARSIE